MALYIHTYTVKGSHRFPFDMLRYDQSFPTINGVDGLSPDSLDSPIYAASEREVELRAYNEQKNWLPTIARWRSFGWEVVS